MRAKKQEDKMSSKSKANKAVCGKCGAELELRSQPGFGVPKKLKCPNGCPQK